MQSERALKPVSENGVRNFVHFCLRSLGPLEICGPLQLAVSNFTACLLLSTKECQRASTQNCIIAAFVHFD